MRIALLIVAAVVAIIVLLVWLNRPIAVVIDAAVPADFPDEAFSHERFGRLLNEFVDEAGDVNYAAWHASDHARDELDGYLAAVSAYSPEATPARFPTSKDELAYWMYGYNAWVIYGILQHWPIDSVTDVKAPVEAVRGLGFFYRLRFSFGGRQYSLLTVENDKIRKGFRDPRIHFVLNCGSESCPVLRPELPTGEDLEKMLDQATAEFVSDPRNVHIDRDNEVVFLSAIFEMYEADFINQLRATGRPVSGGLLSWIEAAAAPEQRAALRQASEFRIEFRDFDWSVNEAGR